MWAWFEASLDPITTYPYAIVVGALESTNVRAYYSSVSSVLWISGFGGNNGYINNVTSSFNESVEKYEYVTASDYVH